MKLKEALQYSGVKKISGDQRGLVLIAALVLMSVIALIGTTAYVVTSTDIQIATNYKTNRIAFHLAQAGADLARHELSNGGDLDGNTTNDYTQVFAGTLVTWDSTATLDDLQSGATGTVTIAQDASDTTLAVITSEATFNSSKKTIKYGVRKYSATFGGNVPGAVTSNGPVQTGGGLNADGREHSKTGGCSDVIADSGTYGIYTYDTYNQSGSSTVAGTDRITDPNNPTDVAPTTSPPSEIIKENATGSGPTTPDQAMGGADYGFPEGTLKEIAQSGVNGSQYATDPSNITFPLSGVTYVELPCGDRWNSMDITGSGVIVVHNSCTDASIENINAGLFNGLIIADDIVHVHADIVGAIVSLTPSTGGNQIGNGNGNVCYSTEVLDGLTGDIGTDDDVYEVYWIEDLNT